MRRRSFLAASAASLALPSVAQAQSKRVLKFIPFADLATVDPLATTAYITLYHGYMVYDTLYGQTGQQFGFKCTPQMVEGHVVENDGKTWMLTLRDGLLFHNGEKVLATDCVASIKRWGVRDLFGQALMARTDEVSAPDDKTIVFRLKQPFPLLPDALGHASYNMCAMMPKRIAETDPFKQITEAIGSGPFRFKADERVQGAFFAYERSDQYKPRGDGDVSFTAGPKIVHFDRIEWHVQPDPATKAAAIQAGEVDWWENPTPDLLPLLRKHKIATPILDRTGMQVTLRPNHLYPPFDRPEVRRALLRAIDQKEFMVASRGVDTSLWSVPLSFFPPVSPMASDAGLSVLTAERDYEAVARALQSAGYRGEKVVLMAMTDSPYSGPASNVTADLLKRVGVNVDYQAMDFGTVLKRRESSKPPAQGGWNLYCTGIPGLVGLTPATHLALLGDGSGRPNDPTMQELREAWFNAPDLTIRKKIAEEMQLLAFENVPYYPLGLAQIPAAVRPDIAGIPDGFPLFWSVRRT
jgi:peptide/nickel transport system substrate-binding protein